MASTTYVQFIKGGLLIFFSTILTISLFVNGYKLKPDENYHEFITLSVASENGQVTSVADGYTIASQNIDLGVVKLEKDGIQTWWQLQDEGKTVIEAPSVVVLENGDMLYNGEPKEARKFYQVGHMSKIIVDGKEVEETGALGPFEFLETMTNSTVVLFKKNVFTDGANKVTLWKHAPVLSLNLTKTAPAGTRLISFR
jgi:cation/acetate symporter